MKKINITDTHFNDCLIQTNFGGTLVQLIAQILNNYHQKNKYFIIFSKVKGKKTSGKKK